MRTVSGMISPRITFHCYEDSRIGLGRSLHKASIFCCICAVLYIHVPFLLFWFLKLNRFLWRGPTFCRVLTGQGKLEKVREFLCGPGKVRGKTSFLKSQGKWSWIMQTADFC